MKAQLLDDVRVFLRELETTQDELAKLFEAKRVALVTAQAGKLMRIAETESILTAQLQRLLDRRAQILQRARQAGLDADSIQSLVVMVAAEDCRKMTLQIKRAGQQTDELRREGWIHWIISQRAYKHYTELLELFAHCGEKPPTYSRTASQETVGGAIFDASI